MRRNWELISGMKAKEKVINQVEDGRGPVETGLQCTGRDRRRCGGGRSGAAEEDMSKFGSTNKKE